MKSIKKLLQAVLLAGLLYGSAFAQATGEARYQILPLSKLTIDGTSTFHNFTIRATELDGYLVVDRTNSNKNLKDELESVDTLKVVVPVKKLDSDKSSMNYNMDKALKADKNPDITFTLKNIAVSSENTKAGDPLKIYANGILTIAGISKEINMTVQSSRTQDGLIYFTGEQKINMTDYGVKPPTMFFGMVTVGDAVTVHFDLTLASK